VLVSFSLKAQPLTMSELAWPRGSSRASVAPPDCTVYASNSLVVISKNTAGMVWLHGSAGTYSVVANPSHGTISGLNVSTGIATYTPDSGFTGSDLFTFLVQSNTCTTNGIVFVNVFDTATTNASCSPVTNIISLDSGTINCATTTSNGVVIDSSCGTNETSLGVAFTGTACSYYTCSLLTTNILTFNITDTDYNNTYTSWLICNPDSVAHTYKISGLYSYAVHYSGSAIGFEMDVFTNNVRVLRDAHGFGSDSSASNQVLGTTFSVGPSSFNIVVRVDLLLISNPAGNYSGIFTNNFQ
jgi:hypothetical protein